MTFTLLPITPEHDADICHIIKTVGAEFGAIGEGFGPSDAEVLQMSHYYTPVLRSYYFVALQDDRVIGGCGIAPFNHSNDICELKKLFLLPEHRGQGIGKALAKLCLLHANQLGFTQCYLDTLNSMQIAIQLYERLGFNHLNQPLEGTPHSGCDVWMLKEI